MTKTAEKPYPLGEKGKEKEAGKTIAAHQQKR